MNIKGNVVILDNLRSAWNTGSIYRTAAAFDFETIIHTGVTPLSNNPSFIKASRDTYKYINTINSDSIINAVEYLKEKDYYIYALEINERSIEMKSTNIKNPFAIILGNEANGVCSRALDIADNIIEIDTGSKKHSLNVSIAFGIFAHFVYKK